jgi:hypothetical protein
MAKEPARTLRREKTPDDCYSEYNDSQEEKYLHGIVKEEIKSFSQHRPRLDAHHLINQCVSQML